MGTVHNKFVIFVGIINGRRVSEIETLHSKKSNYAQLCFPHAFIISASLAWAYMRFEYDWPICDCVGIELGHHSFPTS